MSLYVYTNKDEVPKNIPIEFENDSYFNDCTNLVDSELVRDILKNLDKATIMSSFIFNSRNENLGGLNKEHLSTGTKTLLNILGSPNRCFSVSECADNALSFLPRITDGMILWDNPFVFYTENNICDIVYQNIHYTNFTKFLGEVKREHNIDEEFADFGKFIRNKM